MTHFLNRILSHPIFIALSIISVLLALFVGVEDFFYKKIFEYSGDELLAKKYSSLIQYLLIGVFTFFALFKIIKLLWKKTVRVYNKCRLIDDFSSDELILLNKIRSYGILDFDSNFKNTGMRLTDYEDIRKDSKKTILIMGVGMTNISQNESYLQEQLDRNINIRLLMLNPEVVNNTNKTELGFLITTQKYNDFFARTGYSQESKTSFSRLKNFVANYNNQKNKKGTIEMRVYSSIYPINLTVRDENEPDAELVFEFCFPMTTNRFRFIVKKDNPNNLFSISMKSIEEIWQKAIVVSS